MTGPEHEREAVTPLERLGGWILIVVGGLIFSLCGLCTSKFLFPVFTEPHVQAKTVIVAFVVTAVVGGLPMFAGAFICWMGWGYARGKRS